MGLCRVQRAWCHKVATVQDKLRPALLCIAYRGAQPITVIVAV
jgi:hypothetical protein